MKSAFQTVAIIGKYMNTALREPVLALARYLVERHIGVFIEENTAKNLGITGFTTVHINVIGAYADLAVVIGGDGTLLTVARGLVDYGIPLVGVNSGRLGFLTDLTTETMFDAMDKIMEGEYTLEQRFLLGVSVWREGKKIHEGRALNDVVVSKGALARLIELDLHIDHQFMNRQRSDGLIVSTPTGSTAYALSAGGPLMSPTMDAIALVPVSPHTLSNRPFVINSRSRVEVTLVQAEDARVHFDGISQIDLIPGDKVVIERLQKTVSLLHLQGHSYFDVLHEKLSWN